jgi:beta-lactam-binding protein with PASTA domain
MALSPYSITVARVDVAVDATARTGQFTVDVQNAQSVSDRVVLEIDSVTPAPGPANPPPEPAVPAWFDVEDHLRPIPTGGSEQFLVNVAVPAATAPGSYLMQPVAYSADRPPDVTRVTGPVMTLMVPTPPIPPGQPWWRKWWPWWLVAAVVAILLVVAVVVVIVVVPGGGSTVAVPDESGKSLAAAQSDLQVHRLAVGTITHQVNTSVAVDTVLGQDPSPGKQVNENSPVALTLASTNSVTIPNVVGMSAAQATNTLTGLGLSVSETTESSSAIPAGQVTRTLPSVGSSALTGAGVTIFVSTGPPQPPPTQPPPTQPPPTQPPPTHTPPTHTPPTRPCVQKPTVICNP